LCEPVDIEGVPVLLSDTAGLRETADGIENLGIQRTHRAMSDADLVMVVVDGSVPTATEDLRILTSTEVARRILVLNKCDLPGYQVNSNKFSSLDAIHVSALTGEGLDNLRTTIMEMFDMTTMESGNLLVTNARHHDLLRHAHCALKAAGVLLSGRESEELVLEPLHNALRFLGEITGETTTEEILSQIFATFCIGK
jgi:tRNA modification GTPase